MNLNQQETLDLNQQETLYRSIGPECCYIILDPDQQETL